jgi:hypothetical protein
VDLGELHYVGRVHEPGDDGEGVAMRLRFRLGGQDIDAVVPEAAATTWRQTHDGGATDRDLEAWAAQEAREAIADRLARRPLDVSDVLVDRNVGAAAHR